MSTTVDKETDRRYPQHGSPMRSPHDQRVDLTVCLPKPLLTRQNATSTSVCHTNTCCVPLADLQIDLHRNLIDRDGVLDRTDRRTGVLGVNFEDCLGLTHSFRLVTGVPIKFNDGIQIKDLRVTVSGVGRSIEPCPVKT